MEKENVRPGSGRDYYSKRNSGLQHVRNMENGSLQLMLQQHDTAKSVQRLYYVSDGQGLEPRHGLHTVSYSANAPHGPTAVNMLQCRQPSKALPAMRSYRFIFSVYRSSFPGIKRPGRDGDHSSPSIDEGRNEWSFTATPPTRLHDVDKNDFTFLFTLCQDPVRSRTQDSFLPHSCSVL